MKQHDDAVQKLRELRSIIVRLRGPEGCPWDRMQGKTDIGRYLIEEAYEVIEALDGASAENLCEELGDLLFHILFLSRMAEEEGEFDIGDVLSEITAKMVRRHPHVFAGVKIDNVGDVRSNWDRIKEDVEHKHRSNSFLCSGISSTLPTLAKAQRISARAASAGFDWKDVHGVLEKVSEEMAEFRAAMEAGDPGRLQNEAGDLIFTLVNLCRFVQVDAESALRSSLRKFIGRFCQIERELAAKGKTPEEASMDEMERLWCEAKGREGNP